jgi:polyisoprenoid-binding protein YceI
MAGVTVSGVLWAIFQNNAGGAWDNAKKSFEAGVMINGEMTYKGSEAHKAAVTGDTVGDPFKDTSGPSMNILIKLTCLIGLVIAPMLHDEAHSENGDGVTATEASMINAEADAMEVIETPQVKDLAELTGVWNMDVAHTYVDFKIRHILATSKGNINLVSGSIDFGTDYTTAAMNISIDMSAINTSNTDRDDHLKGADFFDVAKFPTITFVSNKVMLENGIYNAYGQLTVKDVTKDVVIPFEYLGNQESPFKPGLFISSLEGEFTINRSEFGVTGYDGVLGEEVTIEIAAEIDQMREVAAEVAE